MSDILTALAETAAYILVALLFLLGGSALLVYEVVHPPTHTTHVFLFAGFAVLGALMLAMKRILSVVKGTLDVVGPYLPYGRRAYDNVPPKDPPP